MTKERKLGAFLLAAYWIALFVGTHMPVRSLEGVSTNDKLLHYLAYCGLSFLILLNFAWHLPIRRAQITCAVVSFSYGAIDELTQAFAPGRTPEMADWIADAIGSLSGILLYTVCEYCWRQVRPERDQPES